MGGLRLRAGSSYHASGGTLHDLSSGFVHASYSPSTLDCDVSALQVATPFALGSSGISAAALPTAGYYPTAGVALYVTGFGVTSVGTALFVTV